MCKKILLALAILVVIGWAGTHFIPHATPQKIEEGCKATPFTGSKFDPGYLELDVRGGVICHFRIHKDLPIYTFHLNSSVADNTISQIEVSQGTEGGSVLQTLDAYMTQPPLSTQEFFLADQDINFDGYNDIRLLTWWGATGNKGYTYWLFDPSKKIFVYNHEISLLSNPVPNYQSKTISTRSVGGAGGCIYYSGTYRFDSVGKIQMIRFEEEDLIEPHDFLVPESFIKTIGELKDGKMATRTVAGDCVY